MVGCITGRGACVSDGAAGFGMCAEGVTTRGEAIAAVGAVGAVGPGVVATRGLATAVGCGVGAPICGGIMSAGNGERFVATAGLIRDRGGATVGCCADGCEAAAAARRPLVPPLLRERASKGRRFPRAA